MRESKENSKHEFSFIITFMSISNENTMLYSLPNISHAYYICQPAV
jgi:hypothetical protein